MKRVIVSYSPQETKGGGALDLQTPLITTRSTFPADGDDADPVYRYSGRRHSCSLRDTADLQQHAIYGPSDRCLMVIYGSASGASSRKSVSRQWVQTPGTWFHRERIDTPQDGRRGDHTCVWAGRSTPLHSDRPDLPRASHQVQHPANGLGGSGVWVLR